MSANFGDFNLGSSQRLPIRQEFLVIAATENAQKGGINYFSGTGVAEFVDEGVKGGEEESIVEGIGKEAEAAHL